MVHLGLGLGIPYGSAAGAVEVPLNPIAVARMTAIYAAGGTCPVGQAAATQLLSDFINAEQNNGNWSLHRRIYIPGFGNAAANAIDIVTGNSGQFSAGGITHGVGFAQGNGTSGFFDMLVTPVAAGLVPGSATIWVHVLQAGSGTGFRSVQGTTQVGSRLLTAARNAGLTQFAFGDTSGGVTATLTVADADGRGIYLASETATNSRYLRVRRSSGIALTNTNTSVPTNPTFCTINQRVFVWNNSGSNSGFNDAQLSGYGKALGMTTAQADAFTANYRTLWEGLFGLLLP